LPLRGRGRRGKEIVLGQSCKTKVTAGRGPRGEVLGGFGARQNVKLEGKVAGAFHYDGQNHNGAVGGGGEGGKGMVKNQKMTRSPH